VSAMGLFVCLTTSWAFATTCVECMALLYSKGYDSGILDSILLSLCSFSTQPSAGLVETEKKKKCRITVHYSTYHPLVSGTAELRFVNANLSSYLNTKY
jgi:hypothetical protein